MLCLFVLLICFIIAFIEVSNEQINDYDDYDDDNVYARRAQLRPHSSVYF